MDLINWMVESYKSTECDERTADWWIVKHEWSMWLMFASYLYFVLKCGPNYMENKRPYSLKTFIEFYNIFQIVVNAWLVYSCIQYGLFTDFGIGCVLVDRSPVGKPMSMAVVIYWVVMIKIVDMIETVVFVLRKKQRQISFLHLYHHISTIFISQMTLKFYPGGMAAVPIVVNSTVHVIMYTYYLLSSQGPRMQRILNPIKPYITIIQMVQFLSLLGHALQTFLPYCTVPKWGGIVMFTNLIINFVLFYNFYRKNYKSKAQKPKKN